MIRAASGCYAWIGAGEVGPGEGLHGDYNPKDPEDIELLRFYVSVLQDGVWEEKEDASYCTQFPVSATDEEKLAGLDLLLDRIFDALSEDIDVPVKKLGESLSWINLDELSTDSSKASLDDQIHSASIRAVSFQTSSDSKAKEHIPEF